MFVINNKLSTYVTCQSKKDPPKKFGAKKVREATEAPFLTG